MAGGNDNVVQVTDDNFAAEVLQSESPVLVDFWAPWCSPCRAIAPVVAELSNTYDGRLRVAKVNTDESVDTAAKYGIRSIPTLLVFKDGEVVEQVVGAVPKSKLVSVVEKWV